MFTSKAFKKTVRARAERTGEKYAAARHQLVRSSLSKLFGEPERQEFSRRDGSVYGFLGWPCMTHIIDRECYVANLNDEGTFVVSAGFSGKNDLLTGASSIEIATRLTEFCGGTLTEAAAGIVEAVKQREAHVRHSTAIEGQSEVDLRVRQFVASFRRASGGDEQLRGRVEGMQFIVTAFGLDVPLSTLRIETHGGEPTALVREGEYTLRDGYRLLVEAEYHEHIAPNLALGVVREGSHREALRSALEAEGVEANIVAPYEDAFFMYFRVTGAPEARYAADLSA